MGLPAPGAMLNLSPSYEPVLIKGLRIHPDDPLTFDFIIDTGNSKLTPKNKALKAVANKLIKYFFAALTLPEKDVWVNLSPYEKNRIIPPVTGQTGLGRDMLAEDYILKQITASLIYPEKGLGKEFWSKVYAQALRRFGTTRIPVNTFNKVWIVADRASVYEAGDTVWVVDSHLKVMLEEDYLALIKHKTQASENPRHSLAAQVIREVVLPALEKEVNEGKNFANLRQIFHSLILAKWYKETLRSALLNEVYSNKDKIAGIEVRDKNIKNEIYQRYIEAYKKGVFNYIKEDMDRTTRQPVPRKYFSGGVLGELDLAQVSLAQAEKEGTETPTGSFYEVSEISSPVSGTDETGEQPVPIRHGPIVDDRQTVEGPVPVSQDQEFRKEDLPGADPAMKSLVQKIIANRNLDSGSSIQQIIKRYSGSGLVLLSVPFWDDIIDDPSRRPKKGDIILQGSRSFSVGIDLAPQEMNVKTHAQVRLFQFQNGRRIFDLDAAMTVFGPQLENKRILLVEDSPVQRIAFTNMLKKQGAAVDVAQDGVEGLAQANNGHRYDLILTDTNMPNKDGVELIQEIRRSGNSVPIIIWTNGDSEDLKRSLKTKNLLEGVTVLSKIFEANQQPLFDAIHQLTGNGPQKTPGPDSAAAPGGIDLNASSLHLQEQGAMNLHFNQLLVDKFKSGRFVGLTPVITGIKLINDISPFLEPAKS
ncbi:MAG: response regulator [Candidatus Omnitrophica bacterium]|nr:response regulator [Candidatus Omnitrophota bacterium]